MEKKMFEVQADLRAKTAHTETFISDLKNWESKISKKDKELKTLKELKKGNQPARPPVRSAAAQAAQLETKEKATAKPGKSERISSGDYRSWDRFNVDEELKKLEAEHNDEDEATISKSKRQASAAVDDIEPLAESSLQAHMAQIEKDKGNEQFKQGKYLAAAECYSRGIEAAPSSVLYANRAMAYLKVKDYHQAEQDATSAIEMDPSYIKAISRRASARTQLKKFKEAIEDWEAVLRLEDTNKLAKKEILRLREAKERHDALKKATFNPLIDASLLQKQISLEKQKRKFVRIPIEEVGEPDVCTSDSVEQEPGTETEQEKDTSNRSIKIQELSLEEADNDDTSTATVQQASAVPEHTNSTQQSQDMKEGTVSPSQPDELPAGFQAPETAADFERCWELSSSTLFRAQLLDSLNPKLLPVLLRQEFDGNRLAAIVHALHAVRLPAKQPLLPILRNLAKVDRFKVNLMFLAEQETAMIRALVNAVAESTCGDKASEKLLAALRRAYLIM